MTISRAFANKLKRVLKERNMTQYALFKLTGVPQSTISTILKAQTKSIELSTIYDICSGLGIELSEFFDDEVFKLDSIDD
jgi:transcriptional regulator with XRE-family HTH domain